MNSKIKKKIMAVMLAGAMTVTLLATGCGKQDVDYNLEDNQDSANSGDSSGLVGRLDVPESCDVELDVGSSNLSSITLEDDEIEVPKTDKMSIYYYTLATIDNSYKQRVAEGVFDKEQGIYAYDYENRIKRDIEKDIEWYEEERDNCIANGDTLDAEWYDDYVKKLETQLQDAPDEYEAAGDYSGEYFVGTYNDREYLLSILYEAGSLYGSFQSREEAIEYRPYEGATGAYFTEEPISEDFNNSCQITQEDAIMQAEDFLAALGISDVLQTELYAMEWVYYDSKSYANIAKEYDGYVVKFMRGINGIQTYGGELYNVDNLILDDALINIPVESCSVYVDDKGVIFANWSVILEATGEADDDVELLSWDAILEKANTNVAEYYTEYPAQYKKIEFNDARLTYYLAVDDSEEGSYMYIPVWIFSQYEEYTDYDGSKSPEQIVVINAMDGTVIDLIELSKELGTYEEYTY